MKHVIALCAVLGVVLLLPAAPLCHAEQYVVKVDVPQATGVSIVATRNQVVGGVEQFGPAVTEFDFNPMSYDSQNGIYTSNYFYAIDVAATGGAGAPDVTVTYGSESSPAGQVKGLGSKSTITFSKVSGGPAPKDQVDAVMAGHGPTKLLSQIESGEAITDTELIGGFLRMRVGVFDGANPSLVSAGGEPFSNSDLPGAYSGILTVSATIL